MASNPKYSIYMFGTLPTTTNHLATAAAITLRVGDALHRRLLLRFSHKSIYLLGDVPHFKDVCHERAHQCTGFDCFQWPFTALSSAFMSLSFINGDKSGSDSKSLGSPQSRTPRRDFFDGRQWTNILLAANVLVYVAQSVSDGNLLFLGAKINSLISKGQLWRLVTSAFLHANIGHLLVNCYSLNSIGPTVENMCGTKRFLTIYISSAIASASMSYWFCKAPAVGASGAIFGLVPYVLSKPYWTIIADFMNYCEVVGDFSLVGSYAIFVLRHRSMVKGTNHDLKHIAQVIVLNMAIGLLSQGIDNWGHAGGLLGGAVASWLLGPAWELQSVARDGKRIFEDRAPIFNLTRRHPK